MKLIDKWTCISPNEATTYWAFENELNQTGVAGINENKTGKHYFLQYIGTPGTITDKETVLNIINELERELMN